MHAMRAEATWRASAQARFAALRLESQRAVAAGDYPRYRAARMKMRDLQLEAEWYSKRPRFFVTHSLSLQWGG